MKTLIITSNTLVHTDHGFTEMDLQFHADKVTEALITYKTEKYKKFLDSNPDTPLSSLADPCIYSHNTNHTLVECNGSARLILLDTIILQ
jgi:hypothetical protein